MLDLHTHSVFSDGELIPSELVRRAKVAGYRAIALTDHGDHSNIDFIIPRIVKVCKILSQSSEMMIIPGIELTHVPPCLIGELAEDARKLGAAIVLVHGETIVEPVAPGTNLAALNSSIDILAHPGLITEEEASLACNKRIYLEITTRKGHSLTNGHVLQTARRCNAKLVLNTDSHSPEDLVSRERAEKIARGAGMSEAEVSEMFNNSRYLAERVCR
ncbi:MAG: histidinol phosphate phosphatase domain-containing protein [Syntrophales bacterium LBB04]|nr:histidinol phosphate phosphatase domain-containing protein [Syntrophales bacterium LBB04]